MSAADGELAGLAPRWHDPGDLDDARRAWRALGVAVLDDVLAPGLAAELLVGLRRLPLVAIERPGEVIWAHDLAVPPVRDPQLFEPLFRLVPVLDEVLPRLATLVCERPLVALAPTTCRVIGYRKGSWTDAALDAEPGTVVCTVSLAGETWPAAWGGHDTRRDRAGGTAWTALVPAGTVQLADAAVARHVQVITHHVERLELRTLLGPAPEAA
ncbi:MAG: hypothetical protein IPL61_30105 [Myxococcales bacterium]|nr:hypothetical protein [Myxococcales bacterium]